MTKARRTGHGWSVAAPARQAAAVAVTGCPKEHRRGCQYVRYCTRYCAGHQYVRQRRRRLRGGCHIPGACPRRYCRLSRRPSLVLSALPANHCPTIRPRRAAEAATGEAEMYYWYKLVAPAIAAASAPLIGMPGPQRPFAPSNNRSPDRSERMDRPDLAQRADRTRTPKRVRPCPCFHSCRCRRPTTSTTAESGHAIARKRRGGAGSGGNHGERYFDGRPRLVN